MEEEIELRDKTITSAGVVVDPISGDSGVVLRFTDGASATIGASAREGCLVDMRIHVGKGQELCLRHGAKRVQSESCPLSSATARRQHLGMATQVQRFKDPTAVVERPTGALSVSARVTRSR